MSVLPASASPAVEVPQLEVKTSKMVPEMETAARDYALHAVSKHKTEKEVAEYLKRRFDRKFGAKWHCIVGRHYASHVSYEPDHYIYMKIGEEVILLFKSGGTAVVKN